MSDDRKRQQDMDDLNNERAGNETGRITRFLPDRDPKHIQAKKQEDERKLSALMQLMRDPVYAAAYEAAWDAFERAQKAVHDALTETAEAIENLETITRAMDARAHRLGDEAVYQDESGQFFRVNGTALTEEEVGRVSRSADANSFEARRMAQDALEAAQARRAEILEIQTTVLDPARERLADEDNPMSEPGLLDLTDQLDAVIHDVSLLTSVSSFTRAAQTTGETTTPGHELDSLVPDPIAPLR